MQPTLRQVPPWIFALLHHGRLQAELRGADGADITAGAGSDDDEIVGHGRFLTLVSCDRVELGLFLCAAEGMLRPISAPSVIGPLRRTAVPRDGGLGDIVRRLKMREDAAARNRRASLSELRSATHFRSGQGCGRARNETGVDQTCVIASRPCGARFFQGSRRSKSGPHALIRGAGRQVASSQVYRMPAPWRPARRFRFAPAPHSCLGASPTGLSPSRLLTSALRWSCQSSAVVP